MITLTNIALQRGQAQLLENADLTVHTGQHIGVIGRNGTGKSSLFKLLLGELSVDSGELHIPREWQIAHMAQEVQGSTRSAIDYVLDGDKRLRQTEALIAQSERDGDDVGHATHIATLESLHGFTAPNRAEQLLQGLGFNTSDSTRPVSDFSEIGRAHV